MNKVLIHLLVPMIVSGKLQTRAILVLAIVSDYNCQMSLIFILFTIHYIHKLTFSQPETEYYKISKTHT